MTGQNRARDVPVRRASHARLLGGLGVPGARNAMPGRWKGYRARVWLTSARCLRSCLTAAHRHSSKELQSSGGESLSSRPLPNAARRVRVHRQRSGIDAQRVAKRAQGVVRHATEWAADNRKLPAGAV